MKKFLMTVLILTMVSMLIFAGGSSEEGKVKEIKLLIGTGGLSGVYYPVGGGIANLINKYVDNASATVQTTAGSIENIRLIKQNQADFGFVMSSAAYYAYNGVDVFEGDKIEDLRGVTVLYPQPVQIVVTKDSAINSFQDLRGKKVGVGAPASGDETTFRGMLEVAGMTYDDLKPNYISFAEQSAAFKDRQIDAMLVVAGTPTSGIMDVASIKDIKLVPVDGSFRDKILKKYSYFATTTVKKGTYPSQEVDVDTIAGPAFLVTSTRLSDEIVYNTCKAIFENLEELGQVHNQAKSISLDNALNGASIPLHPGAEKYFKEVGVIK